MSINCIACGMPMNLKEDHALDDVTKDYCKHCMNPDGSMQTYEVKLKSYTQFIMKTQNVPQSEAVEIARLQMANLPAWKKQD